MINCQNFSTIHLHKIPKGKLCKRGFPALVTPDQVSRSHRAGPERAGSGLRCAVSESKHPTHTWSPCEHGRGYGHMEGSAKTPLSLQRSADGPEEPSSPPSADQGSPPWPWPHAADRPR